jgi:tRNA(Ile)-lysidine synthetase-like protein
VLENALRAALWIPGLAPPFDGGLLVAFSGGPDSSALLVGLARLRAQQPFRLIAAHFDHGLDPASTERALHAARFADRLAVPFVAERATIPDRPRGLEAAAREARYAFLERMREDTQCGYVVTAHHRDDQAETVALRLLFGTGVRGLAGIRPRRGRVLRPLLGLRRTTLAAALLESGHEATVDVTNEDLRLARNAVRARLLPHLERETPGLAERLAQLATSAARANEAIERRLAPWFAPPGSAPEPALDLALLSGAPPVLQARALALLHERSGARYPPSATAMRELIERLDRDRPPRCDCGDGWRWRAADGWLTVRRGRKPRPRPFTYTFPMPGRVAIPELGMAVEVRRSALAPWMLEGSAWRAGLALPECAALTVRSRRAGDRLRPFGARGSRKLKDVLIDSKVPEGERDRLPLLCVDDQIAWVPGVTIDERFRLRDDRAVWAVEIIHP